MSLGASLSVPWLLGDISEKAETGFRSSLEFWNIKQLVSFKGSLLAGILFLQAEKGHVLKDVCVPLREIFQGVWGQRREKSPQKMTSLSRSRPNSLGQWNRNSPAIERFVCVRAGEVVYKNRLKQAKFPKGGIIFTRLLEHEVHWSPHLQVAWLWCRS